MDRKFEEFDLNDKKYRIYTPSGQDVIEAHKVRSRVFGESIKAGVLLKSEMTNLLIERGIWNDTKQAAYDKLENELIDLDEKLAKGGIKLSEARNIALRMKTLRYEMRAMLDARSSFESETAEGYAEDAHFNYLVTACSYLVYDNSEELVYKSYNDYINAKDNLVAVMCANTLAGMLYGHVGINIEKLLPENEFLIKWKFADEQLRLINKEGKFINIDGHLVDDKGQLINEEGKLIDENNNLLPENIESKPFLDDDGNEING